MFQLLLGELKRMCEMTTLFKAFPRGYFADKSLCSLKFFHRIAFLQDNVRTS